MALNLERFVKCKFDYKNCGGNQCKGEATFDFTKSSVVFAINGDNYSNNYREKATLKIEDLRALVSAYDSEKAALPSPVVENKPKPVALAKRPKKR